MNDSSKGFKNVGKSRIEDFSRMIWNNSY